MEHYRRAMDTDAASEHKRRKLSVLADDYGHSNPYKVDPALIRPPKFGEELSVESMGQARLYARLIRAKAAHFTAAVRRYSENHAVINTVENMTGDRMWPKAIVLRLLSVLDMTEADLEKEQRFVTIAGVVQPSVAIKGHLKADVLDMAARNERMLRFLLGVANRAKKFDDAAELNSRIEFAKERWNAALTSLDTYSQGRCRA